MRTVEGGGVVFSVLVDWGPKIRHALNRIRQGKKRRGMTSHVVYEASLITIVYNKRIF